MKKIISCIIVISVIVNIISVSVFAQDLSSEASEYYIKLSNDGYKISSDSDAIKVTKASEEYIYTDGNSYFNKIEDSFIPMIRVELNLSDINEANSQINSNYLLGDFKYDLLEFNNNLSEQNDSARVVIYVPKKSLTRNSYDVNNKYYYENFAHYYNTLSETERVGSSALRAAKLTGSSAITIVGTVNPYVGAMGAASSLLGNFYYASNFNNLTMRTDSFIRYKVYGNYTLRTVYDINGSRPVRIYSGMKAFIKWTEVETYIFNKSTNTGDYKNVKKWLNAEYMTQNYAKRNITSNTAGGKIAVKIGEVTVKLGK